ncbi:MAG: hypothetical protein N4A62_16735 [Marinisporobacter sp.]|jgi:hypothetical protein|nr:hypothetical protein [Marinisporobacter sp.]
MKKLKVGIQMKLVAFSFIFISAIIGYLLSKKISLSIKELLMIMKKVEKSYVEIDKSVENLNSKIQGIYQIE